ncbi:cytochrome b/b6 domain-containing protein [Kutzneria sp. NPDC051319]|uniref:cytochrome b/b6 domain-containing protein n=1 Tax=Kutzneria sp. NPDC051319 TaxID=3155047 RepID=UPI00341F3A42
MTSTAGSDTAGAGPVGSDAGDTEPERVRRFGRVPRLVHRTTGWLMALCLGTAACLYFGPLAEVVGRRLLVVAVHEFSGLLLPVPLLLGLLSKEFRAELKRLNRFAKYDGEWLRLAVKRVKHRPAGKFNAGQKLYAAWITGAVPVMLFTGLLMWFGGLLTWIPRSSAIFVHDWLALAIAAVVVGHIRMAYRDPLAREGMRTGYVRLSWARKEHPRWID